MSHGKYFGKYLLGNISTRHIQALDTFTFRPIKGQYEELNFPNRIDMSHSLYGNSCRNATVISNIKT